MPIEAESREQRHRAIVSILRRTAVRRQDELVDRLAERGFEVTQSSVSRDLRDLGIAKRGGRYVPPSAPAASPRLLADVAHYVRGVKAAGPHLTVVATQAGTAQAVGLGLDRAGWEEIVGTIAGDDTVFVASSGARDQSRLLHRFHQLLDADSGASR